MYSKMYSKTIHDVTNSDKVIDSLIENEFIYTIPIEKVLRAVNSKLFACHLRSTNFNFVSPCVISTVLECLKLRPGYKLLNIGAENGYFSSIAGLLLGSNGVNHGIEIDKLLVEIAEKKINNFKLHSAAIDYNIFCEPVIIHGNACDLVSSNYYDGVYCRPGVPPEKVEFMKSLIKVGGILLMPRDNILIRITRTDEVTFNTTELFRVANTELILPLEESCHQKLEFPTVEPLLLKELCRASIRSFLNKKILNEFPRLDMTTRCFLRTDFEKTVFGLHDTLSESIRAQYNLSEDQIFYLLFPLETFDDTRHRKQRRRRDNSSDTSSDESSEESSSDDSSYSTDDSNPDNTDSSENNDDLEDNDIANPDDTKTDNDKEVDCMDIVEENEENHMTVPTTSNESANSNDLEAECSDSATKTAEPSRNSEKSTKIDSPSQRRVPSASPSEQSDSDVDSFEVNIGNRGFLPSNEISPRRIYNTFRAIITNNGKITKPTYDYSDLIPYCFQSNRKKNYLSKLLRDKINSLPLPFSLKVYLNYYRSI